MDYPWFIVSNQKEKSISMQRVNANDKFCFETNESNQTK